jgi:hypothetical protein
MLGLCTSLDTTVLEFLYGPRMASDELCPICMDFPQQAYFADCSVPHPLCHHCIRFVGKRCPICLTPGAVVRHLPQNNRGVFNILFKRECHIDLLHTKQLSLAHFLKKQLAQSLQNFKMNYMSLKTQRNANYSKNFIRKCICLYLSCYLFAEHAVPDFYILFDPLDAQNRVLNTAELLPLHCMYWEEKRERMSKRYKCPGIYLRV